MEEIFKKAVKIVESVSENYHKKDFYELYENHKYSNDDVTNKDVETQKLLVNKLSELIENSGFICEEKLSDYKNKEFVWIIDPIDGTFNYKQGMSFYGTQVALKQHDKTIFAVLHLPQLNETYYAYNGKAYKNGKLIETSTSFKPRSIILNIHLSKLIKSDFDFLDLIAYTKGKKLRSFGSSLYDFTLLASGKADIIIFNSNNLWDVEPGLYLCLCAGAKIVNIDNLFSIMVSNQEVLTDLKTNLKLK